MPFPYPTLMRYHIITQNIDNFKNFDAVYYCDADMLFVNTVGNEILNDITAIKHPGYHFRHINDYSYQRESISSAYVPFNVGKYYFCGGFNGGFKYLNMCKDLVNMINIDLNKNICAIWHDESYLNRYLIDNPPQGILSPAYCIPDPKNIHRLIELNLQNFKPKLIALDKNHNEIRN
jgi:histo-blood group ABO system transferase